MTQIQEEVLSLFDRPDALALTELEISHALGWKRRPAHFASSLAELVEDGRLAQQGEKYLRPALLGYAAGTYWDSGRNFGFVTPDGEQGRQGDIFLPPHCSGRAWHGDRVLVALDVENGRSERLTGRVVRIIRRSNVSITGRLEKIDHSYYVFPDGGKLPQLRVAQSSISLHRGDKVQGKIVSYGDRRTLPSCQVLASLGRDGTRQAAVEAILCQNQIERAFPQPVLEAAGRASTRVTEAARRGRLDLREALIFTIDGEHAKDLDDAVSLERLAGGWRLGVHIADVSHYVRPGSPLDQEALKRGTSVYFADQVIPMLPTALSNGICSLNPQVERLTLSCIMEMDSQGNVTDYQLAKSVIRSKYRMTYEGCNRLLAGEEAEPEYAPLLPVLRDMAALSHRLEKLRRNRGALELASQECVLLCDEDGNPTDVSLRESGESEKMIESFMVAANETVARHLALTGKPGVFRVHEKPSGDKLTSFQSMIAPFGYTLPTEDAFGMQKVLRNAKGTPEEGAISMALLRSLMKARYDGKNLGHFGLGAEFYCHFTSPIRRYPDLMVHRILSSVLEGSCQGPREEKLRRAANSAALQSSERERAAEQAERDIEKCYVAELMGQHLGEEFDGVISGVTQQSLFVLLPGGIEGRVDIQWLPQDFYSYDEERRTLTGVHTRRVYSFALPMRVKCIAADPGAGTVDFQPLGEEYPAHPRQSAQQEAKVQNRSKRRPPKQSNRRSMHTPKRRRKRSLKR